MPLLVSPIDGSPMKQIHRSGIEIDVCPTTGGIWLDRGELEKLIALLREDSSNDHRDAYRSPARPSHTSSYRYDDDDDHDYRGTRYHGKKSKMSRIMDIFDF